MLSGQGGAAGMKYIANGKRHQQEIGARRWRPCLIKTNCRWARIFFFFLLTENRLKLPSETQLQPSESRRTGRRRKKKTSATPPSPASVLKVRAGQVRRISVMSSRQPTAN